MSHKVKILCEYDREDLAKAIESLLNKGWRVVNAFHLDGKAFSWCALMLKEDNNDRQAEADP